MCCGTDSRLKGHPLGESCCLTCPNGTVGIAISREGSYRKELEAEGKDSLGYSES